ncbi:hypothetical protein [Achromobacter insuavis]|uniref:Uncharacterized protein n=1 Tax=Achromobacter insuavis AXX-A TaxID=1003200 RepID=F7T918_9BURK|nr:hypothetical protein [Achromobacter insuavis]EGP43169.1 hypothetical protein AXXA_27320 [Achromobacter insuavis AXX-A]
MNAYAHAQESQAWPGGHFQVPAASAFAAMFKRLTGALPSRYLAASAPAAR